MSKPRNVRGGMVGLLAAALSLGAGSANAAPAVANPVQQSAPAPVREFVAPQEEKRAKKKKAKVGKRNPLKSEKWVFGKNGDARDGRGDYRSAKRLLRQRLCAEYGITTGRQWVRLRRELRRAA